MGKQAALLGLLIIGLAFRLPMRAEPVAALAQQIRADLRLLLSQPTLSEWQRSRTGEKIEPAHYELDNGPYDVDFGRLTRWCAASVTTLIPQTIRAALFYVPAAIPGALPPLPVTEDEARIRLCHMEALWYQTTTAVSVDALVSELSTLWGRPNGQTTTPDILASGLWKSAIAWHRDGMNVWLVYDPNGKPRGAGPKLVIYARRDSRRDSWWLGIGSLSNAVRDGVINGAARMAAQDPALTAAVKNRSRCLDGPLKPESESLSVSRLADWLKASSSKPAAQRAAALIVADAYIACTQRPLQPLINLGARFAIHCPQDGTVYDGNFLRQAENIDVKGPGGELAGLASLWNPCSLRGKLPWPDLVIQKGGMLLRDFPSDQWTAWIHFAVACAHASKLSFAYHGENPEGDFSPLSLAARQEQRRLAVRHFQDFISAKPNIPESVVAWREAWRLLAGLPPNQVHFGCGCE